MPTIDVHVLDDDALVARARSGDRDAYGELVRRHQRAALRVAAVVSGSTEEARDIVQDAFVTAHRALDSYRGTGSVRSWLLRVVANHARNEVRGRVRRLRRDDRYAALAVRSDVRSDHWPECATLRTDAAASVAAALGSLGRDDRSVLGCRFVADLSEQETADVLGLAVGTVKSRTSRALGRLRLLLDEPTGGARP